MNNQSNKSSNTQSPITRVSPLYRLRTKFSNIISSANHDLDSSKHSFRYFVGLESKTINPDGTVTYAKTPEQQKKSKSDSNSKPGRTYSRRVIRRRCCVPFRKVCGFSIAMPILLLALREFLPGIEEHIPTVYQFLDTVIVPMIEWLYKVGMKAFSYLMEQKWFVNILEYLKNIAA